MEGEVPAVPVQEINLKEDIFIRRSNLQAGLLSISDGQIPDKPLQQEEIKQRLSVGTRERWDWQTFNRISLQERKEAGVGTIEEWKNQFIRWFNQVKTNYGDYSDNLREVLKHLGVYEVNNQSLQQLLENYASQKSKMEAFVASILDLPEFDRKMLAIQDLAGTLFGKEVSAQICSQIIDLERQIKEATGNEAKLGDLADNLSKATQDPSEETKSFLKRAKELYEKGREEVRKNNRDEQASKKNKGGKEKLMDTNFGFASIANRGKKFHPEGQDRIGIKKLSNGIEYFFVCDGAGEKGHQVADFVGENLGFLLEKTDFKNLNVATLKQFLGIIQKKVCSQFENMGGSTADVIIKLPNNKNFAVHVGEGNIAKIETGKKRNIFSFLFKEHQVEPQDQGAEQDEQGTWRIEGSKSKSFGVRCKLITDVFELEKGSYIIMSDGLTDVLKIISYSYPNIIDEFVKFFAQSPKAAVNYLVDQANKIANDQFGQNADDISAVIVNL